MSLLTSLQNRLKRGEYPKGMGRSGDAALIGPRMPVSHARVREHAATLLRFLMAGTVYPGEVFLCGGAYKAMLNPSLPVNDLDLWVRDRRERERLTADLLARGARLVRDFHPYCVLFDLDGHLVEITYQNVKERPISEIVREFDIAGCAIAATYSDGRITDSYFSPRAALSARCGTVCLEDSYLERLRSERLPTVLRTIDRLERFALEVGFHPSASDLADLWKTYREDYSLSERQRCIDVYMETTAGYKGHHNAALIRTARILS